MATPLRTALLFASGAAAGAGRSGAEAEEEELEELELLELDWPRSGPLSLQGEGLYRCVPSESPSESELASASPASSTPSS